MTSENKHLPKVDQQSTSEAASLDAPNAIRHLAEVAGGYADLILQADQCEEPMGDESTRSHEYELTPRATSYSIASEKHPERNEDNSFFIDIPSRLLAGGVFDGVGGNFGSDKAASLAAEYAAQRLGVVLTDVKTPREMAQLTQRIFESANKAIYNERSDIATTAALAVLCTNPDTDERYASIDWAGDSRVYVIRDGKVLYRTLDDGPSNKMHLLDTAEENTLLLLSELYPSEAPEYRAQAFLESVEESPTNKRLQLMFRYRNIIENALTGNNELVVHHADIAIKDDDIVLLTSDGIHDNLTNSEILEIINSGGGVKELVDSASVRSRDDDHMRAKYDDMTAVLFTA